jgi:ArsR family transcriptional regulator, arsenate/arsenite/antimonite-responsive transcriptional repressor
MRTDDQPAGRAGTGRASRIDTRSIARRHGDGVKGRVAGAMPPQLLFRAFADSTRLRILHLVARREICVGDLATVLRIPQAMASRHLKYLRNTGFVQTRKSGLWIYYSLGPSTGRIHSSLLACISSCLDEMPALAQDLRRLDTLTKAGGCCSR